MKMRWLWLLLFLAVPALAQLQVDERILSFHSDIAVREDSSMEVRETIRVRAAGDKIRRGIYRDFPTRYRDPLGNRVVVDFEPVEVLRDGRPEPWHTEGISNGVRVYFGAKDVFLSPGEYTYTFTYRTRRQLGFFADHDELYWNVTGNGWDFAIAQASAAVKLPSGIAPSSLRLQAWTGAQGSKETAVEVNTAPGPLAEFRTITHLDPHEGLTVAVSWPKGHVAEPTAEQRLEYLLSDNLNILVGVVGLQVVLLYYLYVWWKVGRDPERGVIMPIYDAPQGLSPAAMRYLVNMGFDDKVMASALLNMAVKKFLTIEKEDSFYTLQRAAGGKRELSADEKLVADKLLAGQSVKLKQEQHAKVRAALDALKTHLKNSQDTIYFFTNRKYLGTGLVLSALLVVAIALSAPGEQKFIAIFMSIWLTGWSFGVFFLLKQVLTSWRSVRGGNLSQLPGAIFISLFSLPFVGGEIFGVVTLAMGTSLLAVAILGAAVFLNILFHHLLKAPTRAGRELLDKVEGFKMFLSATEKDRLNVLFPLARTPETFEKYLPYALALDVEQEWAEQFSDVLAQAGVEPGGRTGYSPSFYRGGGWSTSNLGSFASGFGSSMAAAVAASSSPPGRGSGSGGGGSSGGGGGGGGGGGW